MQIVATADSYLILICALQYILDQIEELHYKAKIQFIAVHMAFKELERLINTPIDLRMIPEN